MALTFSDILAPITPEQFATEYRDRRPLHVKGGAGKFAAVLTWADLSGLLSQSSLWSSKSLELVLDGRKVEAPDYCSPAVDRDQRESMLVDTDRLRHWLRRGASMVLNDVDALTPGLKATADALEAGLGGKIQGNLYCSWAAHPGFASHFDTHDVFAIHVEGKKTWRIYGRHFVDPIAHASFRGLGQAFHDQHKGPVTLEARLEPGDLLYIPRGWYHDALATSEATIHIAFGLTRMIGVDVLTALYERAVQEPLFRQALPDPDDPALGPRLAELGRRVAAWLADPATTIEVKAALAAFRYRRGTITLPDDALARRWRRRHDRFQIRDQGGRPALGDGAKFVPIPPGVAGPVGWIIGRDGFAEPELALAFPALDAAARAKLLAELTAMKVLEPV